MLLLLVNVGVLVRMERMVRLSCDRVIGWFFLLGMWVGLVYRVLRYLSNVRCWFLLYLWVKLWLVLELFFRWVLKRKVLFGLGVVR